ncbi:hypothetical protein BH24ACT6_BH24ACT6_15750 [soil metagenome]
MTSMAALAPLLGAGVLALMVGAFHHLARLVVALCPN